jgi:hypothetical protein
MKEEDYDYNLCYEDWLHYYRNCLPPELVNEPEKRFQELYYLYRVFTNILRQFQPAAYQVMLNQFPRFKEEARPLVVDRLHNIINRAGQNYLLQLFLLVYEQRAGVNVREKYPDFEKHKKRYGQPEKPNTIDDSDRDNYPSFPEDRIWEIFRDGYNKDIIKRFEWRKKREDAYINLLQEITLSQFSLIHELNGDEWIIYALWLQEDYGNYYLDCDMMCSFIDCKLPEEDIKLNMRDLHQKIMETLSRRDINDRGRPIDK